MVQAQKFHCNCSLRYWVTNSVLEVMELCLFRSGINSDVYYTCLVSGGISRIQRKASDGTDQMG